MIDRVRHRLARQMRFLADRIDPTRGPRGLGWSFTIEPGRGMVFHRNDRVGCRLWYMAEDYDRAFGDVL